LALAQLFRAEANAGIRSSHKTIVNLHLDGGPSHLDAIDLKPSAPIEIRGEFSPISTKIPGFAACAYQGGTDIPVCAYQGGTDIPDCAAPTLKRARPLRAATPAIHAHRGL
jgi:hypothetical protein